MTHGSTTSLLHGGVPSQRGPHEMSSSWLATHSRKVLRDGAAVDVLIDINTAIMRGLRGEGEPR